MPILTATITALGLYGGPDPANESYYGKTAPSASTRTYTEDFTTLGPNGVAAPDGPFTGKTGLAFYEKTGSDSVRAYVREGDITDVDIASTDSVVAAVGDTRSAAAFRAGTDSVVARVTDAYVALAKSSFIKTAAESVVPVITESRSIAAQLSAADSVVAVVTDAESALGQANEVTSSDSIVPVVTDLSYLDGLVALLPVASSDSVRPFVFDTGSARPLGDVDGIKITVFKKSIRITRK